MSTKGQNRVRVDFNTTSSTRVDEIKKKTAELIDLVNGFPDKNKEGNLDSELIRLKSIAMTEYENAGHWAVKAYTYNK